MTSTTELTVVKRGELTQDEFADAALELCSTLITRGADPKFGKIARMNAMDVLRDTMHNAKFAVPSTALAFITAGAMNAFRALLNADMVKSAKALMGTKVGFNCDESGARLNDKELADILAEALLNGVRFIDNEFNVIAKGFFLAKNGSERLARELCDSIHLTIGDIEFVQKRQLEIAKCEAIVTCVIEEEVKVYRFVKDYKVPHTDDVLDTRIDVRVNKAMGIDAVKGKLINRLFKAVLNKNTSFTYADPDDDLDVDDSNAKVTQGESEITSPEDPQGWLFKIGQCDSVETLTKLYQAAEADPHCNNEYWQRIDAAAVAKQAEMAKQLAAKKQ